MKLNGTNPSHAARSSNSHMPSTQKVIKLLLKHGADPSAPDENGALALNILINDPHFDFEDDDTTKETVKFLIKSGVDPRTPDKSGATPAVCAERHHHEDLKEYLEDEGITQYQRARRDAEFMIIIESLPPMEPPLAGPE